MKNKAPAFQFYPKDWLTDPKVRLMSFKERGIYWELCCYCWLEGSLPDDLETLADLVGLTKKELEAAWLKIRPCFQKVNGQKIAQPRLNRERARQRNNRNLHSKAGKIGMQKRWHSEELDNTVIKPLITKHNSSSSTPELSSTPVTSSSPKGSEEEKHFAPSPKTDSPPPPCHNITLPLNNGTEYQIPLTDVDEYRVLYPAVDVDQAIRNMRGWCLGHPKELKTQRGIKAFITTWLKGDQDKGGGRSRQGGNGSQPDLPIRTQRNLAAGQRWLAKHEELDAKEGSDKIL